MKIRPPATAHRDLGPLAAVIEGSRIYRVVAGDEAGHVVVSVDTDGESRFLPAAELATGEKDGSLKVVEGYFLPNGKIGGKTSRFRTLGEYPAAIQRLVLHDLRWVMRLYDSRKDTGKPSLSHASLTAWIQAEKPFVSLELEMLSTGAAFALDDNAVPPKVRKNGYTTTFAPPGATALRDNLRKLEGNEWDPMVLVPNWHNCTEGGLRIDPEVRREVKRVAPLYAEETRPSIAGLRRRLNTELELLNKTRSKPLALPSEKTIARIIEKMPEVQKLIGRKGIAQARQKLALVGEGPKYTRVGQRVVMDCWKMHLMTIYKESGQWSLLSDEAKAVIKPIRVWVAVLMDSASGCILGISFGISESTEVILAAFRMSLMDRTHIAAALGAEADWLFPIGFDQLETDGGAVFKSADFWVPAISLIPRISKSAGDHPRLRGQLERFWGTIDSGYLPDFTGRTFANITEKGVYDAQKRASMVVDQVANGLIRWVVDVHHQTKPNAPLAQSPRRKFHRLYNENGAKQPYTSDQIRKALGFEIERELRRWGIRHANVMYNRSPFLESFLLDEGPQTVRVKVDPLNIGQISVLLGNQWVTVGGPPELDGVGLSQWIAYNREMERRYLAEEAVDWPIIAKALRSFMAASEAGLAAMQIQDLQITESKMRGLVNSLKLRINYDNDPSSYKAAPSLGGGTLGQTILPTGEVKPLPQPPAITSSYTEADEEDSWNLLSES